MNLKIKLSIALVMSLMLVACGGGGSDPVVKTEKVWRMVKEFKNGNLVFNRFYDNNGWLEKEELPIEIAGGSGQRGSGRRLTYHYDDKGILKTIKGYTLTKTLGDLFDTVDTMDKYGKNIKHHTYTPKTPGSDFREVTVYENTFDDKNRLIKKRSERSLNEIDAYTVITEYTYDGNTVRVYVHNITTRRKLYFFDEYNNRGDQVARTYTQADGGFIGKNTYENEYDGNGNITKQSVDGGDNGNITAVSTYEWKQFDIPEQ